MLLGYIAITKWSLCRNHWHVQTVNDFGYPKVLECPKANPLKEICILDEMAFQTTKNTCKTPQGNETCKLTIFSYKAKDVVQCHKDVPIFHILSHDICKAQN